VRKKIKRTFYRINWQIRAPKLRLIDESGKQIGVYLLDEARKKAREEKLDLVEIASGANPPVAKLIDFNKFKYQESKKKREERKKQKGRLKEIRLTPFIEKADLDFRLKKIEKFLKKGCQVKIVVRFWGRQITKKNFGYQLIDQIAKYVSGWGEVEKNPKLMGKRLIVMFKPIKKNEKEKAQAQKA